MSGYCGRHRVGPGTHHPERHLPKSPQHKRKHCNTSTDYSHGTPPYTTEGSSTSPDPSVETHIQSSMIATFGCTSHHFLIFKLFSQKNDLYFAETIAKLKKKKKKKKVCSDDLSQTLSSKIPHLCKSISNIYQCFYAFYASIFKKIEEIKILRKAKRIKIKYLVNRLKAPKFSSFISLRN